MVNVNDMDVKEFDGQMEDRLDAIFQRQTELEKKYREIEGKALPCVVPDEVPVPVNSYLGQHQIKEQIFRTIIELAEAADCMKNKPWKQTMMETDVTHMKEEMADAFHFFIQTCILMGIDAEELYNLYFKKSEVNKFRQRSQY